MTIYSFYKLAKANCYAVWATTIAGQNAFAPALCFRKFHVKDGQNIRDQVIEGPNTGHRSACCAFHTFLVEVQTNAEYIHATHG